MSRVAVTGATGLLGRYTVAALAAAGHDVLALSRAACQSIGGVDVITTDYSTEHLGELLSSVDVLIHLAAVRGGAGSLSSYAVNVDLTDILLGVCVSAGVSHAILASTISVYSDANVRPWSESNDPVPTNNYGLSKLAMEKLGARIAHREGTVVTSLRIGHLYGAFEDNDYLFNRFFRLAFVGERLRVTPPSENRREIVYAGDAADACVAAVAARVTGPVNVPGYERLTNYEIAAAVCAGFETGAEVVVDETLVDAVLPTAMHGALARELLGYGPTWPMADACRAIRAQMEAGRGA